MLDDSYLLRGLDALSRAHTLDYFADGHRGAAIIAATFFCREIEVEEGVPEIIRQMIDKHWAHTELCAPFPGETSDSALIGDVVECLVASMGALRQAGHNVILPALALKAFQELPETVTPSRIEGICRLIGRFTATDSPPDSPEIVGPDFGDPSAAADFVLSELITTLEAFEGRGQGWSGHLVTYARALLDLGEMGHRGIVEQGEHGFRLYLRRIRQGPLVTDIPRPEHRISDLQLHQRSYWERRSQGDVGIGHLFKYPYGFAGLMTLAGDRKLKQQCAATAYHIL